MGPHTTIPDTQTGYGFQFGSKQLVKYESIPVPRPGPQEALLKVEAAGMCQSDLHILYAQEKHIPKKFIMGHEVAGQLVAVGDELDRTNYPVGGRFSLFISDSCGVCEYCRVGRDNQCDRSGQYGRAHGLNCDGGYQQYLLVKNVRSLIAIDDNVSYEAAAVATDSVLTPFHAIAKVRHLLGPTTKVLVVGMGGLGLNAVQILKNFGCYIVAADVKDDVRDVALKLGANEFYTNIMDQKNHEPESFDICIDVCGLQPTHDACQRFAARNAKILMIGLGRAKLSFLNYHLARREVELIFSFGGSSSEQAEVMKWISLGKIKPIYTTTDLENLPQYLNKLAEGKISGRVVFRPSKL